MDVVKHETLDSLRRCGKVREMVCETKITKIRPMFYILRKRPWTDSGVLQGGCGWEPTRGKDTE